MPLVSVIVPVYNLESCVSACLRSLQAQTFSDWEAVCVNDGSKDKSSEILHAFAAEDPRIRCLDRENGGVSSARNAGLEEARGEYICFLDGDDMLHPQFLEFTMRYIDGYDLLSADFTQVSTQQIEPQQFDCPAPKTLDFASFYHYKGGFDAEMIGKCVWGKLYRAEVARAERFPVGVCDGEDMNYIGKLLSHHPRIGMLDVPLYYYYEREDSATRSSFSMKTYTCVETFNELCTFLGSKDEPYLSGQAMRTLYLNIFRIRTQSIGTQYSRQVRRDSGRIGRRWIGAWLRNGTNPWKTRLLFTAFFFCNPLYIRARIHLDPSMREHFRAQRKNGKEDKRA